MPVSPPLSTTESGTSTLVRPTNTLEFNGADFTVTGTGDKATISIDSTGAGAALTDTQVGFGNGSNLLTGQSDFVFIAASTRLGIGAVPNSTVERLHITGTGTGDLVRLESTDAGSGSAPDLVFYRSSASPAANDYLGRIDFRGLDSGAAATNYGAITGQILDPSAGSEDGAIVFKAAVNGDTNLTQPGLTVKHNQVVVNDGALAAMDLLVKGDNDNILSTDASQDNCGIGTSAPDSGVERLHIKGTGASTLVKMETTEAGATPAPDIVLYRNTASPAADDIIGSLQWTTNASDGSEYVAAKIESKIVDTTAGSENAKLQFYGGDQGGNQLVFEINGAADLVVNPDSNAFRDFSVKSSSITAIFCDASNDNVGIGTGSPNSNALLHITDDGTKANTVRIESTDNDTSVGPVLDLRRNNADGTATDGDNLGVIQFTGLDDGGGSETYARIRASAADTHSTLAEGAIEFLAAYNNVETEVMRIGPVGDGGSANFGVDINYNSQSTVDFRVRGDNVTNLMYIDGSTDKIGFGEYPAGGGPQVQVDEDLSCLRPYVTSNAATLTLTDAQCHNKVVHLTYDTSAQAITMPTAVSGMCVTLVRQQASNAPTVVAASGEKINGTAAPSTLTMGAQYSVMILHGVAGTGWIAYEPAVAS